MAKSNQTQNQNNNNQQSGGGLGGANSNTPLGSNQQNNQDQKKSKVDMDKLSEAFGHFIGKNLKTPGVNFNLEKIIQGMREGAAGKPAPMSDQEYEAQMAALQEQVFEQLASDNLSAANDFMKKNKGAAGVFEVEPGKLQYIIMQEGKGPAVSSDAKPLVHYKGMYLDGTTFDSSENVGGPVPIPLDSTISGFSRGVSGMKEGEKRKIFVHPDLGYGTQSPLPPNAMLIFEVEVVKSDTTDGDE